MAAYNRVRVFVEYLWNKIHMFVKYLWNKIRYLFGVKDSLEIIPTNIESAGVMLRFTAKEARMIKRFYLSPVAFFDPQGGDDKSWRPRCDVHLFSEPGTSHGIFETDGVTATVALVKIESMNHALWQGDADLDSLCGADLDTQMTLAERVALNGKTNEHADISFDCAKDGDSMRNVLAKIAQDICGPRGKSFAQPEWF